MVVDEAVATTLRARPQAQVATFVASCAERMVQIFTGLCGGDPARGGDVDFVVGTMADLWRSDIPVDRFRSGVATLDGFPELAPDEEFTGVADIYAFYSVLVLRYAALYRSGADTEDALKCAHASLTAMAQLDQNLPGAEFFAQEAESQQRALSAPPLGDSNTVPLSQLMENDRVVSRERLAALHSRFAS
ncbi:hypothetical protein OG216_03090 [Streptomycetaceae bacterium NBC_01309]